MGQTESVDQRDEGTLWRARTIGPLDVSRSLSFRFHSLLFTDTPLRCRYRPQYYTARVLLRALRRRGS